MNRVILLCALMMISSFAMSKTSVDLMHAPKNFVKNNKPYIFVDFIKAHYQINYLVNKKDAQVVSTISFYQPIKGYPLFEFSANKQRGDLLEVKVLNGKTGQTIANLESASIRNPIYDKTSYRTLNREFKAGLHTIQVKTKIDNTIKYAGNTVASSFWLSDLNDRSFLEKYIPSNLDYDRYTMSFDVKVLGTKVPHTLMSNCARVNKAVKFNQTLMTCSPAFNSASLFFHIFPTQKHVIYNKVYKTIDGREIPIMTYGHAAKTLMRETPKILRELEADYGPWPHPHVIIFGWPPFSGGMEYSGATATSTRALGHELHHSYFARSMFPAGGNGGWIDEALASWRDNGYPTKTRSLEITKMAGHSIYRRDTDRDAYTKGAKFIAHLNHKFSKKGGMKKFKREVLAKKFRYSHMTTPKFQTLLENYFDTNLQALFDKYVYGIHRASGKRFFVAPKSRRQHNYENPYHKHLSDKQLIQLL